MNSKRNTARKQYKEWSDSSTDEINLSWPIKPEAVEPEFTEGAHRSSYHEEWDIDDSSLSLRTTLTGRSSIALFESVLFPKNKVRSVSVSSRDKHLKVHWLGSLDDSGQFRSQNMGINNEGLKQFSSDALTYNTWHEHDVSVLNWLEDFYFPEKVNHSLELIKEGRNDPMKWQYVPEIPKTSDGMKANSSQDSGSVADPLMRGNNEVEKRDLMKGASKVTERNTRALRKSASNFIIVIKFVDNCFLRVVDLTYDTGIYKLQAFCEMRSLERMTKDSSYSFQRYTASACREKSKYSRFAPRVTLEDISRMLELKLFSRAVMAELLTSILDIFVTLYVPTFPESSIFQVMKKAEYQRRIKEMLPCVKIYVPSMTAELLDIIIRRSYDRMRAQRKRRLTRWLQKIVKVQKLEDEKYLSV